MSCTMNAQYTHGPQTFSGPYPMLIQTPQSFPHDPRASPTPSKDKKYIKYHGGMAQNQKVVERHIPGAAHIEFIASHAVVYEFVPSTKGWLKSGVEGTLFIVSKDLKKVHGEFQATDYAVFVMNRSGLDNFIMDIGKAEIDIVDDIIVLMDKDHVTTFGDMIEGQEDGPLVCGIWVFADPEGSTAGDRKAAQEHVLKLKNELEYHNLAPLEVGQDLTGLDYRLGRWFHFDHPTNQKKGRSSSHLSESSSSEVEPPPQSLAEYNLETRKNNLRCRIWWDAVDSAPKREEIEGNIADLKARMERLQEELVIEQEGLSLLDRQNRPAFLSAAPNFIGHTYLPFPWEREQMALALQWKLMGIEW